MPSLSSRHVRTVAISASIAMLASAFAVGGGPAAAAPIEDPERALSHFLCYDGRFPRLDPLPTVQLDDEFISVEGELGGTEVFCTPVRKKHGRRVTPIVSERQHLRIYRLDTGPELSPIGDRLATNQFMNDVKVRFVQRPSLLAVPTRKRPHRRPRGLDHFACRDVVDPPDVEDRVKLRDQFRRYRRIRVSQPVWLCTPAEKTHGGKTTSIHHPNAHLLCHRIADRRLDQRRRWTVNQFERSYVKVRVAVVLCVPTILRETAG